MDGFDGCGGWMCGWIDVMDGCDGCMDRDGWDECEGWTRWI